MSEAFYQMSTFFNTTPIGGMGGTWRAGGSPAVASDGDPILGAGNVLNARLGALGVEDKRSTRGGTNNPRRNGDTRAMRTLQDARPSSCHIDGIRHRSTDPARIAAYHEQRTIRFAAFFWSLSSTVGRGEKPSQDGAPSRNGE